ncbi:MAG: Gfo/Idh/MocA family oxidoreductase [Dehalococcoidia bacterium]
MQTTETALALTLIGTGPEADRWAKALRGVDGVGLDRIAPGDDELLASLSRAGVDAVAFVAPVPDLPGAIKRAVLAGRHVFVTGAAALSSRQLMALADLSQRRRRAIVFDNDTLGDEQVRFVRKMTSGANPLWRPRYLRALRTGFAGDAAMDALAVAEVGRVLAIAGALPSRVSAVMPRVDDETGAADVALLTLWFEGGPVARIDISLVEPALRQELVIGCDARTIVLQPLDREAPMLIQATGRHRGPKSAGQWAETVSEHPVGEAQDRAACAAEIFVTAVRADDATVTNAEEAAHAALVWERARASMSRDGEHLTVAEAAPARRARAAFEVIEGGGRTCEAHEAPHLTLVARR